MSALWGTAAKRTGVAFSTRSEGLLHEGGARIQARRPSPVGWTGLRGDACALVDLDEAQVAARDLVGRAASRSKPDGIRGVRLHGLGEDRAPDREADVARRARRPRAATRRPSRRMRRGRARRTTRGRGPRGGTSCRDLVARLAVVEIPSIFQMSGSTPAFCSCRIASIISCGRTSTS